MPRLFYSSFLKLAFICTLTVMLISCVRTVKEPSDRNFQAPAQGTSQPKQGGQDGGGGNTRESTADEIEKAIQLAFKVALNPALEKNLFYRFYADTKIPLELTNNQTPKSEHLLSVLDSVLNPAHLNLRVFREGVWRLGTETELTEDQRQTLLFHYLKQSEYEVKHGGPCDAANNHRADASVSAYKVGSKICFSTFELKKIPPDALYREILGLLIHEAAHLKGLNESDAVLVQDTFTEKMKNQLSETVRDSTKQSIIDSIWSAKSKLEALEEELLYLVENESGGLPSWEKRDWNSFVLGQVSSILDDKLPNFDDQVDAELRLAPAKPELYDLFKTQLEEVKRLVDGASRPTNEKDALRMSQDQNEFLLSGFRRFLITEAIVDLWALNDTALIFLRGKTDPEAKLSNPYQKFNKGDSNELEGNSSFIAWLKSQVEQHKISNFADTWTSVLAFEANGDRGKVELFFSTYNWLTIKTASPYPAHKAKELVFERGLTAELLERIKVIYADKFAAADPKNPIMISWKQEVLEDSISSVLDSKSMPH